MILQLLLQPTPRARQRGSLSHSDSWPAPCDSMQSPRLVSQTADPDDPEVSTIKSDLTFPVHADLHPNEIDGHAFLLLRIATLRRWMLG